MIKKVLIAEDQESANISVQKTLEQLNIVEIDYVYYCDDALQMIANNVQAQLSYDLLITDLLFEEDTRRQDIKDGVQLIIAARAVQPDLKVLVFSAESRPGIIDSLFRSHRIDGYVRKARNDAKELLTAIEKISQNQIHFPRHNPIAGGRHNTHNFTEFDVTIISLLAQGVPQKNIPTYLQQKNIKPSGLSSVEKRLNYIKTIYEFSKNEQLVAYCKDMGIL